MNLTFYWTFAIFSVNNSSIDTLAGTNIKQTVPEVFLLQDITASIRNFKYEYIFKYKIKDIFPLSISFTKLSNATAGMQALSYNLITSPFV